MSEAETTKTNESDSGSRMLVGAVVGLLVVVGYLMLYLGSPVDGHTRLKYRTQALWNVFVPDDIINIWQGGSAKQSTLTGKLGLFCTSLVDTEKLFVFACTGVILIAAWLIGAGMMRLLGWDGGMNRKERFALGMGVGLNTLSLWTLACGLVGFLNPAMTIIGLVAAVGFLVYLQRQGKSDPELTLLVIPKPAKPQPIQLCVVIAATLLTLLVFYAGAMPPSSYDVREYHLQIPKEWYQQGYVGFVPHNIYGNMPFGAEMHALYAMPLFGWWWGAIIGKTVIAAYLPLTAFTLYVINERLFGRVAGAVSMLLFLTFPAVFHNSVAGLIDTAAAYYFVTGVYVAIISRCPDPEKPTFYRGRIALAGYLAGSAVACKYPSVLFLVIPVFLWVVARRRIDPKAAVIYVTATAAACGLWLGKNLVLTGNPVYPLVYEVFGGKTRTDEKNEQWTKAHRADQSKMTVGHFVGSVREFLYKETWLNPAMIPLALLALGSTRRRILLLPLAVCVFDFASWWLFTHRLDRFLLPTYGIVIMLSGVGAQYWSSGFQMKYVLRVLIVFSMLLGFFLMAAGYYRDSRYMVGISALRVDIPMAENADNTRIHPAHRYLNKEVKPGNHVLCVGEAQVFDLEVGTVYNTCFDDCIFEVLLKGKSRAERLKALHDRKITHVFIHWSELKRFRSPGNYGYTDYVTKELVRNELQRKQRILIGVSPMKLDLHPESGQVFRVAEK